MIVKIGRFHNIYGPYGTWDGGEEKAPAAIVPKKLPKQKHGDQMAEVHGDGLQTRSFFCILMSEYTPAFSTYGFEDFHGPVNIGSERNGYLLHHLAQTAIDISGKI